MWYAQRISRKADAQFVDSVTELMTSTSRGLIFVTGGVYLVWHLVVTSSRILE